MDTWGRWSRSSRTRWIDPLSDDRLLDGGVTAGDTGSVGIDRRETCSVGIRGGNVGISQRGRTFTCLEADLVGGCDPLSNVDDVEAVGNVD